MLLIVQVFVLSERKIKEKGYNTLFSAFLLCTAAHPA